MGEVILTMKGIDKSFPGVHALDHVDLEIRKGEVHALMGENGAGKSTLMKVLTGIYKKDSGTITYEGKEVEFANPRDAQAAGVVIVHQELNMMNHLTVAQNIFIGREIMNGKLINDAKMNQEAAKLFDRLNIKIDPTEKMGNLTVGRQQMCEIAKAISHDAKVIIFDEPSAALTEAEIEELFKIIRDLRDKGMGIVYISHRMDEIKVITDRVTVMRDGEHIITEDTVNLTEDSLINAMVGRTLDNLYPKEFGTKGEVWLEAKGLNEAGVLHDVSFKAHAGQITGFAGLVGAGRTETMRVVFGADKLDSGEIYVKGEKVHIRTPKDAIKRKIAFLTEDRKGQGLVLNLDVRTNLVLANMKGFSNGPFLDKDRIEQAGNDNVSALKIKTPSLNEVVGQLSGGNQQKVVIGKWVNTDADIFIFDEPTRGIDVGAKIEVYRVMNDLVKAGKCVIMVSSELPEILAMSDHVVVMRGGRVMADIDRDTPHFNSEDIMKAAWGGELD